jgi:hypothetical protein
VRGLGLAVGDASVTTEDGALVIDVTVAPATDTGSEPDVVAIGHLGRTAGWSFAG